MVSIGFMLCLLIKIKLSCWDDVWDSVWFVVFLFVDWCIEIMLLSLMWYIILNFCFMVCLIKFKNECLMGVKSWGFCLKGKVMLLLDSLIVFNVIIISNIIKIIVSFIVIFVY